MDFFDKKVLVLGAAKSGVSAASTLVKLGADVSLHDKKSYEELKSAVSYIEEQGVKLYLGESASEELIKSQDIIIASPGIPLTAEPFIIARKYNKKVIGEIELGYLLTDLNCQIAAITGTNGKTTTTALTAEIINNYISDTRAVGNIGNPFCDEAVTLTKESFIVAEISSFQLETIDIFKPKISAVLNITPDHLDRHNTLENYIEIKKSIFKNCDESCYLVLNYDDEVVRNMGKDAKCKVVYFSRLEKLDKGVYLDGDEIKIKLNGGYDDSLININSLNILGDHNVENAMASAAIAACAGVPAELISKGLAEFKGVAHRIEFVDSVNNIAFYNDSKGTNPDASIKAINAMKTPIVLIAGGYDKGSDFTQYIDAAKTKTRHMVVLGATTKAIVETAKKAGFYDFSEANTFEEAVQIAFSKAHKGDSILLSPACASWGMFNNFEERGNLFKKLVLELKG